MLNKKGNASFPTKPPIQIYNKYFNKKQTYHFFITSKDKNRQHGIPTTAVDIRVFERFVRLITLCKYGQMINYKSAA
jgi:hypothetical protein